MLIAVIVLSILLIAAIALILWMASAAIYPG